MNGFQFHPLRSLSLLAIASLLAGNPMAATAEDAKPEEKITFDDHIRPIFREHCVVCHDQNDASGGLALDSFAATMTGGSSGEVILPQDLGSSRLWALVNHDERPYMPPDEDPIDQAKRDLLSAWIEGGAPENAGSKVAKKKNNSLALAGPVTGGKPENPAMPEGIWRQPVVYSKRAGAVTAIACSPWAPLIAVAGQKQIVLFHSDTGKVLGVVPFPEGIPYVLRFSRDGSLLLAGGGRGGHSGYAILYDVTKGQRVAKLGDEFDIVLGADISSDHRHVALGGPQKMLRVYATDTGELLYDVKKHTDWIYAVAYSPDGVLLASSDRANGLIVWEAETARIYLDLLGHKGAVTGIAWRPDSNVLASGSIDGTVKLWEMNDGKAIKSWTAHGGGVMGVSYTHDGRIVTVGRDKLAKIWDGNGKLLRQFEALPDIGLEVAATHDGGRVVAGDWSGVVRMWETADGKLAAVLPPNPPTLAMLADAARAKLETVQSTAAQAEAELAAAQKALSDKATAAENSAKQAAAAVATATQIGRASCRERV